MPGAPFRHGLPGYAAGPYETAWRKRLDGKLYFRRVGDRDAEVEQLGAARWRVTITPGNTATRASLGAVWPVGRAGVYGGRKAGRAAADEYLTATLAAG